MSFTIYLRTIKENAKLLTNKKRHKRVKDEVMHYESKRKLVFKKLSKKQQLELRYKIVKEAQQTKNDNFMITLGSLLIGLDFVVHLVLNYF